MRSQFSKEAAGNLREFVDTTGEVVRRHFAPHAAPDTLRWVMFVGDVLGQPAHVHPRLGGEPALNQLGGVRRGVSSTR
jgi:hypothetical protein